MDVQDRLPSQKSLRSRCPRLFTLLRCRAAIRDRHVALSTAILDPKPAIQLRILFIGGE
jgi:hypothetical protein